METAIIKALAKKHREKCRERFEECTRLASCSINCIGGIKSHPECETGFYCRYDDNLSAIMQVEAERGELKRQLEQMEYED